MKKYYITVLLFILITACVFGQSGTIRELTGEVELKRAGTTTFVAASAGDTVAANTIISTGFRSTAIIAVGNSLITVRPLTRLTLAEIQSAENTENLNVNLQAGRVRVDVRPPAGGRSNVSVQSPSATASVRGTSFDMDVDSISVVEGSVIYSGNAGPAVMVAAGNSSHVETNGTTADPAVVTASSLAPPAPEGTPAPEMVSQPTEEATGTLSVTGQYN